MRKRIAVFIAVIQLILLGAHWLVYETWIRLSGSPDPAWLEIVFSLLSVSFVSASLLSFRFSNGFVRLIYKGAATWLGILNSLLLASIGCWGVYGFLRLASIRFNPRDLVLLFALLAAVVSLYGILNASRLRVKRIKISLPNLPAAWHGRVAAQVSDVHLGHIRGRRFARSIVETLNRLQPDVVFLTGDLFDGTPADLSRLAAPWSKLAAPLGAFFITGNHEEFRDPTHYFEALRQAGVRTLDNEKVELDGVQILGVRDRATSRADSYRAALRATGLSPERPSILLAHAPRLLTVPEEAGVSLQLSGHTHGGQLFPGTWITRRIYGPFRYGLNRRGAMSVYTSSGAGTWGPPMRLGSNPEIILMEFEPGDA